MVSSPVLVSGKILAQSKYAAQARSSFKEKKYDKAITLYRKHLRKNRKDYNTWNQLGASYYHTGLPKRGLRYLKHVQNRTTLKSYNYYYQGLCYSAIGRSKKAKDYFTLSAVKYKDEYASRATYEMAAIEYKARDGAKSAYWLNLYRSRYPSGVYYQQVNRMLISLQTGNWLENVDGVAKQSMEKALFKYNPLSLSEHPHYWFWEVGSNYEVRSGQEPANNGKLNPTTSSNISLLANAGVGIGPLREGKTTAFAGYTYRQKWLTESERWKEFSDEGSSPDFGYFPFRPDLLERYHQFYGDIRRQVSSNLYWGVYGRYELARIGSNQAFFGGDTDLAKVQKISDTQTLIPWVGAIFNKYNRTLFYWYLRKEINEESPEFSNKTYDLGFISGGDPLFSLGLSHQTSLPELDMELSAELFQYEFIYNDPWLDYSRKGAIASIEYQAIPRLYFTGSLGIYNDIYPLDRIKMTQCNSETSTDSSQISLDDRPRFCQRTENGTLISAGAFWNWTQFNRFSLKYQVVQNKNSSQKEDELQKQVIVFRATMAFPSVTRVLRFTDRYADSAFTKQPQ